MATITVKGCPAKKTLRVRLRLKKERLFTESRYKIIALLKLPFILLFTTLNHRFYKKDYKKRIITLRNELTKIKIPKHLRLSEDETIFCSFPEDTAEKIAFDTKKIKIFIRDVVIGPEFTTEEQRLITEEVARICKKHFPHLKAYAEIKGSKANHIFSEL